MPDLAWMAWTPETAVFFAAIALLLVSMILWGRLDPRNAPRGFRCARARMSVTRQLTRGVLPRLRETTPYARAERLARVSENIEPYAIALLARLFRDARACSLIMIAAPAREFCINAPVPARAAADTS